MSSPWWREANKAWYATISGRQELLTKAPSKSDRKGRDRASEALQKKLALRKSIGYDATIVGVLEEFLTWSEKNQAHGGRGLEMGRDFGLFVGRGGFSVGRCSGLRA
jgi:hypothetical protein